MDDSFIDGWPHWVRWMLVLPAGILAYIGVQVIVVVLSLFSQSWLSWLPDWALQLINSALSGYAMVYFVAWMAPRGRVTVAVIFTVLLGIFAGISFMAAGRVSTPGGPVILALAGVLTLAGGGFAALIVKEATAIAEARAQTSV